MTLNGLVGFCQHGVVDFLHVIGNRSNDGSVGFEQIFRLKPILFQMPQDPLPLPELPHQDLHMGRCPGAAKKSAILRTSV